MKYLYRSICLLFLASCSLFVSGQNLSIAPSTICEGDNAFYVFNYTPTKTVAYYKFWFDSTSGTVGSTSSVFTPPGGNHVAKAVLVYTDSTMVGPVYATYSVYFRPIAKFSLASFSKDTQCFKGNSFCFTDSSKQNPLSPSNPISSCFWTFDDGSSVDNCAPILCHNFSATNQKYDIILKVTDTKGCWSFANSLSIFIAASINPQFTWSYISGPCFASTYKFTNTSAINKTKVQSYKWDFGDGANYAATAPFNALQSSHYDTISHTYTKDGQFIPSLIITDIYGCTDTIKYTYPNLPPNISLPRNIVYKIKLTASTSYSDTINRDSFCAGSNLARVYFHQDWISFTQLGNGDIVWDFGDPNDPNKLNKDSTTWTPSHLYSGVGKYIVKFTVKNVCKDSTTFDTVEVLGPRAKIENTSNNSIVSLLHKYQCLGNDTVDFVNNSSYYKSNHVKRVWDFDDDFAPVCTAYSVPKSPAMVTFTNAQQQYFNSNHFYISNGTTYAGRMNCRYSLDSLPRHLYTNWDSVLYWYQNGKTFPGGSNTPSINANTQITITASNPLPDPFWQAQGRLLNLTSGTLRNKFDSITYTIPGFGTFKRYGNQKLPNSGITFHEYVFRYVVVRPFAVSLSLTDSFNHASGDPTACSSVDQIKISHGKPDAHGMSVSGRQCPGLNPTGYIRFNLKANGNAAGTKPSCGQTSVYINFDSLADRLDATPFYLDGFTTWGVSNGTTITPGPGFNQTPGGIAAVFGGRPTFYTGMNWNPMPPSPWSGPDGTFIQYHYGGNAGTPPPADTAQGYVTIGLFLGSGQKDSTMNVWSSNFKQNQYNNGTPLRSYSGSLINPSTGLPWTYKDLIVGRNVANRATPPPTPIPSNWRDDSVLTLYSWNGIINSTPLIRYPGPPVSWDTLLTLQYVDYNNPRCVSDTVWYHNFLHIKELDATFIKSPVEWAVLREEDDTMKVIFKEEVQDSIFVNVWTWGDNTATIDSFHYAGYDVTDSYYSHGVRRMRYNIDYTNGFPGILIDSIVNPCGVFGQRQYIQPIRSYLRMFDQIGTKAPDSLILVNKFPSTTHFDQWYPYTNYHDTIHLRMRDTMLYTQVKIIDTSLMLLPVTHQFKKSSWEIAGKGPGATITQMLNFLQNSQQCTYFFGGYSTIGLIDTLTIYSKTGKQDSIFCKNDPVRFVDSVRYFRYDNQRTNVPLMIYGTSRNQPYGSMPEMSYSFDTVDFWRRDAQNPSDTLVEIPNAGKNDVFYDYNGGAIDLTNYMIDFVYFNEGQRNYDVNMWQGQILFATPNLGHWDFVLKGGGVSVVIPQYLTDSAYMKPFPGKVIFYPVSGPLGNPGIYVWNNFGGWYPAFAPVKTDSLNSVYDISKTPSPVKGRTLIYNKGKGNVKRTGMYYWNSFQWIFICNSPYTSFPYYTHRLYWDFGDGTPLYQGVRPTHNYNTGGKYKVSMISRDSLGHFDTCISFVNITDMVAKPVAASSLIGCKDTASFMDSSYSSGGNIVSRKWWFGDNTKDTITVQSTLANPVWYYKHNGKFKVKLTSTSDRGCSATGYLNFFRQGPRPAFKLLSNINGCKPYQVALFSFADSIDKRSPSDTPTVCTIFYWGDGQNTIVFGRHDTVWHTYADTGSYIITAAGRDVGPFNTPLCPVVYFPDTASGQNNTVIYVRASNIGKISGNANPHINDTAMYSIAISPGATYTWNVQSGTVQSGAGTNSIIVKWATATGIYNVVASKNNMLGCIETDTLKVHVLVQAVKDLSSVNEIKLYPNPAKNEVTISMNSQKNQDLNIKIYDMLGKVCAFEFIKSANGFVSKNISLSNLSKGIYFVEISNTDEKTVTKLLIE